MAISRDDANKFRYQSEKIELIRDYSDSKNLIKDIDPSHTPNGEIQRAQEAVANVKKAAEDAIQRIHEVLSALGDPEVNGESNAG